MQDKENHRHAMGSAGGDYLIRCCGFSGAPLQEDQHKPDEQRVDRQRLDENKTDE